MAKIIIFTYDTQIDRRALLQCKTLLAHGHEVTLYAMPLEDPPVRDPVFVRRVEVPDMPFVLLVRKWLEKHCGLLFGYLLAPLRYMYWMLRRDPSRLYRGLYRRALQELRPADLFIAHDLPMLPVAVEAKRRYGGKILYDSHELFPDQEWTAQESRMWHKLEKTYIGKADAVVTINPSIAREMEGRYGLKRVEVIYNAEWVSDEAPERGRRFHDILSLPPEARVVLYQGGLSFQRNLKGLVQAMVHVADPAIHLVFLGDGPARGGLRNEISRLGLQSRVHMLDAVPQEELLAYTASADLGVIPYQNTCLNNYYCTPNKLFEFIAAGLPIIATDLPEIARIIGEHQIGMVGDTGSPESIAQMVVNAMAPETLAQFRTHLLAARKIINWQNEGERFAAIVAATLR